MVDGKLTSGAMFQLFAGEKLGEGSDRQVYACRFNYNLVIKVDRHRKPNDFPNRDEWANWQACKDNDARSVWLAPCIAISSCGSILIQNRVVPLYHIDEYPKRVPAFIRDVKPINFGRLPGTERVVSCDYSYLRFELGDVQIPAKWNTARLPQRK